MDAPGTEAIPEPKHGFLPFLRHKWFWLVVAGQLLVLLASYVAVGQDSRTVAWLTLPAYILFMMGAVLIFDRHVRWGDLPEFGKVLGAGLLSGFAAFVVARILEGGIEPRVVPFSAELWLAGPVEETSKLLLPVLLLAFGGTVFKDPRAGLLMVLTSAAFFGVAEGVFYSTSAARWGIFAEGFTRPVSEMGHPFMTGIAASVIWLAAWRANRVITRAGLLAWVAVMVLHSVHDGLGSFQRDPQNIMNNATMDGDFWFQTLAGGAFATLWVIVMFLLARHTARELPPPAALPQNSSHWRPQQKSWGVATR